MRKVWGQAREEGKDKNPFMMLGNQGSDVEGNHIYFYEPVSQDSISALASNLREVQAESLKVAAAYGGEITPPPIHLHIHSYGGEIFAGFAGVEAILRSEVPVHTHIEGSAASAATFLSLAGSHRTIGQYSWILIHQMNSVFWGKYEEFKDEMINQEVLMDAVKAFYTERANISKKEIKDILKKDLWFDAKKALALGLVDEVI